MFKRKNIILYVIIAFVMLLSITSCGNSTDANVKEKADVSESKQKYVIDLNMDNYLKYIDIKYDIVNVGGSTIFYYYFQGTLSYAYYDNVVITSYRANTDNTSAGVKTELSTGGYARWYESYNSIRYTITEISGKVIYWI